MGNTGTLRVGSTVVVEIGKWPFELKQWLEVASCGLGRYSVSYGGRDEAGRAEEMAPWREIRVWKMKSSGYGRGAHTLSF
jgi:hypothetical protein